MIDTGIPWIGQVPEGWKVKRFKFVVVDRAGGSWGEDLSAKMGESRICLRIADFDFLRGVFKNSQEQELTYRKYDLSTIARLSLRKGDILVEKSGGGELWPVGRSVRFDKRYEALFANFMDRLRVDIRSVIPEYFEYYWQSMYFSRVTYPYVKQTTGIQNLNLTALLECERIILPPLPTQRAIAAYLDGECGKIDALRTKIEAQIADLATYKKSVITEAVTGKVVVEVERRGGGGQWCVSPRSSKEMKPSGVEWIGDVPAGWKVSRLKYTGIARNGLTYTPSDLCEADEGCLVLRSSNVQGGKMSFDDNVYVRSSIPAELIMQEDDILICSRNGSRELIGKNAIFREKVKASFGAFMMVFRAISAYPKFAYWAFNSTMFASYLGAYSTSTINQLVRGDFNNMELPLPPLPEQREIAAYLDEKCAAIDAAVAKCREQLTDLASYKKSLIYECVTGKKEVA